MKATVLQVVWHDTAPVLSVDFHVSGRVATGGGDRNVRVWRLQMGGDSAPQVEFLATLTRHQGPVNVVRFSYDGERLASSGDDGTVILWKLSSTEVRKTLGNEDDDTKETWTLATMLRGGGEGADVYDIAWAPSGTFIASTSIDHSVRVYDISKGNCIHQLRDHSHYVQGIAWDPLGHLLVSQSSDRTCRVYETDTRKPGGAAGSNLSVTFLAKISRAAAMVSEESAERASEGAGPPPPPPPPSDFYMFQDESLASFFRRLAFSPDGSLLVVPAGQFRGQPTVYVFARNQLTKPLYHLPGHKKTPVVVRFSPLLYTLRQPSAGATEGAAPPSLVVLPYRMVFAVATSDTLAIYDTQQLEPIAVVSHLHYSSITDLAWNADGTCLMVSSRDGFCSSIVFDANELGDRHTAAAPAPAPQPELSATPDRTSAAAVLTTPDRTPDSEHLKRKQEPSENVTPIAPAAEPAADPAAPKAKKRIAPQLVSV